MTWPWSKVANAPANAQAKADGDYGEQVKDDDEGIGTALASLHDASSENLVEPVERNESTITAVPQSSIQEKNMSFITDVKSFASKFESEIAKLWSKAPSFATVAETTLTFVGPILETVFTIEGNGPAATAVGTIIGKAQSDLTAVSSLITVVGPTPSVKGLLAGVVTNLSSLLSVAQISDPKSVANVNLVISELNALVNAFPASIPATPAA